jgi:hypothetical protein
MSVENLGTRQRFKQRFRTSSFTAQRDQSLFSKF